MATLCTIWLIMTVILNYRVPLIKGENYTVTLLYPISNVQLVSIHYFGAFIAAIEDMNEDSVENGYDIQLNYNIADTVKEIYFNKVFNTPEWSSLKLIGNKSQEGTDAFIGPGFQTCACAATTAAAYNKPMVGYVCNTAQVDYDTLHPTFSRTVASTAYFNRPVEATLKNYKWNLTAVISGAKAETSDAKSSLINSLELKRVTVSFKDNFDADKAASNLAYRNLFFKNLKETARVIFYINDFAETELTFFQYANEYGLGNGDYVIHFITNKVHHPTTAVYSAVNVTSGWGHFANGYLGRYQGKSSEEMESAIQLLKRSFIIAPWGNNIGSENTKTFRSRMTRIMDDFLKCTQSGGFRFECFFTNPDLTWSNKKDDLYDAVKVYYETLVKTKLKNQDTRNGEAVMKNARNVIFKSRLGYNFTLNEKLDFVPTYSLLYFQLGDKYNQSIDIHEIQPIGTYDQLPSDTTTLILNGPSSMAGWENFPVRQSPKCGFKNELCPPPDKDNTTETTTAIVVSIVFIILICVGLYIGLFMYRRRLLLTNMSWKIDESQIQITNSGMDASRLSLNASKNSLSNQETRGNIQLFTKVAIYKSQLVACKVFHKNKFITNRIVLQELRDMLDLSHENINPFLGIVLNPQSSNMIIYQYCPKGSLQDVLSNEDIKLDSTFLSSFVKDIVKGMVYLHHSSLKSHGRLKSCNCIVDSRWLIKITDFGTNFLRNGLDPLNKIDDNARYTGLLWTAPELLRMSNPLPRGTQKADVYSFGIILQEIITRSEPFAMHELDAVDIIRRVKAVSDPPFRPAVQKYHAAQSFSDSNSSNEMYQLMLNCLTEDPTERPTFSETRRFMKKMSHGKETNVFEHMVVMLEKYSNHLEKVVEDRTKQLIVEKKKTDDLVHRMLPKFIADQLKNNGSVEAEWYDEVTVYFSDVVGFTTISGKSTPMQVVDFLNDLYTLFDNVISTYDAYKVETIGDAYMVVSGLPVRNGHLHAAQIADLSLHLLRAVDEEFVIRHQPQNKLRIRIGLHSGAVAAGVVGLTMPRYCLFGDTVNVASRMESNGIALRIHISQQTKDLLESHNDNYHIEPRDQKVELKNVGIVQTYWLNEKKDEQSTNNSNSSVRSNKILLQPLEEVPKKKKSFTNFLKRNSVAVA
ncbi:speract receptor-like [Clytia hemisphaerica]|uniref:Guanylate cyclase n=1 Tax=Clytia hemisphaerica TaxID=252671 RepID=A0A7M5X2K2_9CNID